MEPTNEEDLRSQRGFVVLLFLLLAVVLFTSLAFAVDMGKAFDQQRKIQIAADAASLAALHALGSDTSYSKVLATVLQIAQANHIDDSEVILEAPRCGTWSNDTFTPLTQGVCRDTSTAVEVTIRRRIPTNFARFIHQNEFNLSARAVAALSPPQQRICIRPFGIEDSFLSSLGVGNGDTFAVSGTQESGNWGKLDINGNASSGEEYTNLMLHNLCDEQIAIGSSVSAGTGNAAIEQVFETLLNDTGTPPAGSNMVFAVTTDFGVGNSAVEILRFVRVDLVAQQGRGQRWTATFRIVEMDTQPDPPSYSTRQLVQ
jgi:hypothetical protein